MNVTRFNQHLVLPEFKKELERCEFCAIDQEMTGVDCPGQPRVWGGSPEDDYDAKRTACLAYEAFQFGIALFTPTDSGVYEVRPYNFYLLNKEGDLRLNLGTIPFHIANHLSFQTWFSSGMAYCNAEEESKLLTPAAQEFADGDEKEMVLATVSEIEEWHKGEGDRLELKRPWTLHAAKVTKRVVDENPDLHVAISYTGKPYFGDEIVLTVERKRDDQWEEEKSRRQTDREQREISTLGFRLFWKALVAANKPIVGHNFAQDLMFMMNMHEAPLPADYNTFKEQVTRTFPSIYDTKTMAAKVEGAEAFLQTHLGYLYQECRQRGKLSPGTCRRLFRLPPGFFEYDEMYLKESSKAHEGAYDAYMTGIVFYFLRKLYYGDSLCSLKNEISSFGSVYYVCTDRPDTLVNPCTFIVTPEQPCFIEQLECTLFSLEENKEKLTVGGKIDMRKLSYKVVGMQPAECGKYHSFCVAYNGDESADQFISRLTAAPSGGTEEKERKGLKPVNVSAALITEYHKRAGR